MKKVITAVALVLCLTNCTKNQRAKRFGGTMYIDIPKRETFINATWKGEELWYTTKDSSGVMHFREHSNYGLIEGEVVFE